MATTQDFVLFVSLIAAIGCSSADDTTGGLRGDTGGSGPGTTTGTGASASSSSGSQVASTSASGGPSSTSATGSGTSSSGAGAGSTSSSGAGGASTGGTGLFEAPNPWNTPVANDATAPSSDAVIQWLSSHGGWGTGIMQIDFEITLQTADASTPYLPFTPSGDFYSPDCDQVPFPVPAGGAIEGEDGYACNSDGDCHLIVVDPAKKKLYEMWRAFAPPGSEFNGGCTAVWDLTKTYPANLRGDGCTSADAGGFPIASMLFTADEVAAGNVAHAIRFILPNSRIRGGGVYLHPATHTTGATSGGSDAPPYGVRLRLKSSFDLSSLPSDGARIVAKAMQTYGIMLSDGGQIALTAADDRFTTHKWADVGIDAKSLSGLSVTDFEVVDMGDLVSSGDCVRNSQ